MNVAKDKLICDYKLIWRRYLIRKKYKEDILANF